MARNRISLDAPPERVFEVLSDPRCYPRWVVGAKELRDADDDFPAPGSRFHHSVGVGPFTVDDRTEVLEVEPPYRIELRARARPLGTARITILVEPAGDGTRVTLIERAGDLITRLVFNPLTDPLVHARNDEALRRLQRIVEHGGPRAGVVVPAPAAAAG